MVLPAATALGDKGKRNGKVDGEEKEFNKEIQYEGGQKLPVLTSDTAPVVLAILQLNNRLKINNGKEIMKIKKQDLITADLLYPRGGFCLFSLLFVCFLREGLAVQPQLACNLLCKQACLELTEIC